MAIKTENKNSLFILSISCVLKLSSGRPCSWVCGFCEYYQHGSWTLASWAMYRDVIFQVLTFIHTVSWTLNVVQGRLLGGWLSCLLIRILASVLFKCCCEVLHCFLLIFPCLVVRVWSRLELFILVQVSGLSPAQVSAQSRKMCIIGGHI